MRLSFEAELHGVLALDPCQVVEECERREVVVGSDVIAEAGVALRELNGWEQIVLHAPQSELAAVRLGPSLVVAQREVRDCGNARSRRPCD